jgi:hypothetical protein
VCVCVFSSVYVFHSKHANGKEAVALRSGLYTTYYKHQYIHFGALHDGKQPSVEQLQWHKWHLFPMWSRYSYFVGLVCVNCANGNDTAWAGTLKD